MDEAQVALKVVLLESRLVGELVALLVVSVVDLKGKMMVVLLDD